MLRHRHTTEQGSADKTDTAFIFNKLFSHYSSLQLQPIFYVLLGNINGSVQILDIHHGHMLVWRLSAHPHSCPCQSGTLSLVEAPRGFWGI